MYLSSRLVVGGIYVPWIRTLLILSLMVSPKSEHADKNWLNSVCRSWAEWARNVASKSIFCTVIVFTFNFAFSRAELNRRPSDLICSLTSQVDEQKARFNTIEKKIPKRDGARTQPCFTPLLIVNDSETLLSYWAVAFVLLYKDFTLLKRLEGQLIFINHLYTVLNHLLINTGKHYKLLSWESVLTIILS